MLLPVIKIDKKLIINFNKFGFVNTYLHGMPRYEGINVIHIEFQPKIINDDFSSFIQELMLNSNFLGFKEIQPMRFVVSFNIPDMFKQDFSLFKRGKYSKLSADWKKCFPMEKPSLNANGAIQRDRNGMPIQEHSNFYHIFNKTQYLRDKYKENLALDFDIDEDLELFDIINDVKETLMLNY